METSNRITKSTISTWGSALVFFALFAMICTVGDTISSAYGFGGPPPPGGGQGKGHHPPQEPTIEMVMEMLKKELQLTDGQVADIQPAFSDLLKKEKELKAQMHEKMKDNMEEMQQAETALRKETLDEVSNFITEEQTAKLEDFFNHLANCQKRPGNHPPPPME